jgi:hypothetical protein
VYKSISLAQQPKSGYDHAENVYICVERGFVWSFELEIFFDDNGGNYLHSLKYYLNHFCDYSCSHLKLVDVDVGVRGAWTVGVEPLGPCTFFN